ncbi:hypothetical protein [Streptomyces sp. NPDC017086]|uniref:hypothetical protein n=1 Tax=Streptomyces sp. NPDC017086 TaxID=3364976 RepID=UPI0037BC47AA
MNRFLTGLAAGVAAGGITRLFTAAAPWLLLAAGATAAVVWFGQHAVEALADAITDLF